jgi:N-acetylmuramoyl-L-alanine amidase
MFISIPCKALESQYLLLKSSLWGYTGAVTFAQRGVRGTVRLSRISNFLIFISCALLLTALPLSRPVAAGQWPLAIEKIRTGQHGISTRLVIDFNRKTDFRVFHLANPARIVIDLPPTDWHVAKSQFMLNSLLQGYRSGTLDDGLTRVIFDLRKTAVVDESYFLPKNDFEKDRLVIDLKPVSANLFDGRLTDVFGNRDLKGPGTPAFVSGYSELQNKSLQRLPIPADPVLAPPKAIPVKAPLNNKQRKRYTIVIDAGHGGGDPGAMGPYGTREKIITLAVAREIERQLEETGRYNVVLTRNRDVYVKLRERVEISRRVKADLFISIHADKIARTGVRGASIYTLSENASDAETARLAEAENNAGVVAGVDLAAESEDVAGILLDLAMREKMNESKLLSHYLETAFMNNNVRLLPNSHRAAGFAVLKAPDVPSVLIETGFLSNGEEAKLLSSSLFQSRIAGAVVDGIDSYFRKILALQKM